MRNKSFEVNLIAKDVLREGFLLHRRTGEADSCCKGNGSVSAHVR